MSNLLISLVTAIAAAGPSDKPSAPCNESIRQQDLKADLFFLAGDAFQGRLTGTAGNNLAAEFIASRFERLGLKRMGERRVVLPAVPALDGNARAIEQAGIQALRRRHSAVPCRPGFRPAPVQSLCRSGRTLWPSPASASATRQRGHDDYRNVDVRDKIVLVLAHEPGENDPQSPFDGLVMSEASNPASQGADGPGKRGRTAC